MEETAYTQFVELEERHFWFVGRRAIFFSVLDEVLDGRKDLSVLDVGCGAGGMLGPLERYGKVTGIEPAPEMAELCRRRGYEVIAATAQEMPVPPSSVDLVALFDTIEHIADDLDVLRRCREVLRPGGTVFVSVPAYQFLFANNDRVVHHQRRYTARDLRRKLLAAGLEPVRVTYFNALLFPVILPVVMVKKAVEAVSDPGDATNLSHEIHPLVNRLLAAIMSSERHLLSRVDLPFGHSLVAVARRTAG